jgi:hypothetical protein
VALALVLLVAALVYWRMLRDGGLYYDDWWHRAAALYDNARRTDPASGPFGYLSGLYDIVGFRPALPPILALQLWIAGDNPHAYQALALADTLFATFALYAVLRLARVPWGLCTAAAVLFACLPMAGATRFWMSGGIGNAGLGLMLTGFALGALGLRSESRRRSLLLQAASVLLVVAGALAYDATIGVLALALPFYLAATRLQWRPSLVKTALDVVPVIVLLPLVRSSSPTQADPLSEWPGHAWALFSDGSELFFRVLTIDRWPGALAILVVVGAGLLLAVKAVLDPAGWWSAARPQLRGAGGVALAVAGLGFVAGLAGYLAYVPGNWYSPLLPGQGDRTNGVASAGFAVAIAAALLVLAVLLGTALRGRAAVLLRGGLFAALVGLATISFVQQSRAKGDQYIKVWQMSDALVSNLPATFPDGPPPAGTMIYSFGAKAFSSPYLQALAEWGDLDGAVKLTLGSGKLDAMPIFQPQRVVCGARGAEFPPPTATVAFAPGDLRPYGKFVFMNAFEHRAETITSRRQCEAALARFTPGPL